MLKGLFQRVGAVLAARAVVDDELLNELEAALMQADVSVPLAAGSGANRQSASAG